MELLNRNSGIIKIVLSPVRDSILVENALFICFLVPSGTEYV